MPARAQSCGGLYQVAERVISAYDNYDQRSAGNISRKEAKKALLLQVLAFFNYGSGFFRAADGIDTDADALISQCDIDTRIAVYKAAVEAEVFFTRVSDSYSKTSLDSGAFFLYRLMLVLQKSNQRDGGLVDLTAYLKRAYVRQHLSLPQNLLDVDAYVAGYSGRNGHNACAISNVDVSVTKPIQPIFPESARDLGLGAVSVEVQVTVGPTGNVIATQVDNSSGNMDIDQAALGAARESSYAPKIVGCQPVEGNYLFRATFIPN